MEAENKTDSKKTEESNTALVKLLKNEIHQLVKQQTQRAISSLIMQKDIEDLESRKQNMKELEMKILSTKNQLQNDIENNVNTRVNFENYIIQLKQAAELLQLQVNSLKNNLETCETYTNSQKTSQDKIMNDVQKNSDEQIKRNKAYQEELDKLDSSIKTENMYFNCLLESKKLVLEEEQQKLDHLIREEEDIRKVLEEENDITLQLEAESQMKKNKVENLKISILEMKEKIAECENSHRLLKSREEETLNSLEQKLVEGKERNRKISDELNFSKNEHNKLDLSISQIQEKLRTLEANKISKEEQLEGKVNELNNYKTEITQICTAKKLEIHTLENEYAKLSKYNDNLKASQTELQEKIHSNKEIFDLLKENLIEKSHQKDCLIHELKDMEQKHKDKSLKCETEINKYHNEIKEVQFRNEHNNTEMEDLKKLIQDKIADNEEQQNQLNQIAEQKGAILQKIGTEKNHLNNELERVKRERDAKELELKDIQSVANNTIIQIKKVFNSEFNKIDNNMKKFRAEKDKELKKLRDQHEKEKKNLESVSQKLLEEMNDLKTSKENLQQQLKDKVKDVLEAIKCEEKKTENAKKVQSSVFPKAKIFKSETITSTSKKITKNIETDGIREFGSSGKPENKPATKIPDIYNWESADEISDEFGFTQKPASRSIQSSDQKVTDGRSQINRVQVFESSAKAKKFKSETIATIPKKITKDMPEFKSSGKTEDMHIWPTNNKTSDEFGLTQKPTPRNTSTLAKFTKNSQTDRLLDVGSSGKSEIKPTTETNVNIRPSAKKTSEEFGLIQEPAPRNAPTSKKFTKDIKTDKLPECGSSKKPETKPATKTPNMNIWPTDFETSDEYGLTQKPAPRKIQALDQKLTDKKSQIKKVQFHEPQVKTKKSNSEMIISTPAKITKNTETDQLPELESSGKTENKPKSKPPFVIIGLSTDDETSDEFDFTQKPAPIKTQFSDKKPIDEKSQTKKVSFSSQSVYQKKCNFWSSDENDNADIFSQNKKQKNENEDLNKLFDSLKGATPSASIDAGPSSRKAVLDSKGSGDSSDDFFFGGHSKSRKIQSDSKNLSIPTSVLDLSSSS